MQIRKHLRKRAAAPIIKEMVFVNGDTQQFHPAISYGRAASATRFNSAGSMVTEGSDVPRWNYDPVTLLPTGFKVDPTATNVIPNSTMVGATSSVLPTTWTGPSHNASPGLVCSVVGTGTEFGMAYTELRFLGTATGTGNISVSLGMSNTTQAATPGQSWCISMYTRLVAGSKTNWSQFTTSGIGRDGSGVYLGESSVNQISNISSTLTRVTNLCTLPASTAFTTCYFFTTFTAGAVDATLRVYAPQYEQNATGPTSFIPTSTVAVTRAGDAAYVPNVLLMPGLNANEGTILVKGNRDNTISAFHSLCAIDNGVDINDRLELAITTGSGGKRGRVTVRSNNVLLWDDVALGDAAAFPVVAAAAFQRGNYAATTRNRGSAPSRPSPQPAELANMKHLSIGSRTLAQSRGTVDIAYLSIFNKALSDNELTRIVL